MSEKNPAILCVCLGFSKMTAVEARFINIKGRLSRLSFLASFCGL